MSQRLRRRGEWSFLWDSLQRRYCEVICLIGLVIALVGCEMTWDETPSEYQPVQPRPQPTETLPDRLAFTRGICTDHCREIIAAGELSSTRKQKDALEKIARLPNLTSHEQIHLVDMAEAKLDITDRADIFIRLAENPTLTKEARRYLKLKADTLMPKDSRELKRELEKNPGVQRPFQPPTTPSANISAEQVLWKAGTEQRTSLLDSL